jgi:hypothetical protein
MHSTLYPKITNKLADVRQLLVKEGRVSEHTKSKENDVETYIYTPDTLEIVGTVKLHGTHADIVIHSNDTIIFQSRNQQTLTRNRDNCGFVAAMELQHQAILQVRNRYHERFCSLIPATPISEDEPLILAGEWIGQGIQKHVAIVELPRKFVIISASLNGTWLPDEAYADIHDEKHNIYHISRSGFYHSTLRLNNLAESMRVLEELTANVEKECPFALTFNVTGKGEGIVWKFVDYPNMPESWFKVKGLEFTPTQKPPTDPIKAAALEARKGKAGALASRAVTEVRLEQAWDYLKEMGVRRDNKATGVFLKWIVEDVMTEEKSEIGEKGIEEKVLNGEITQLARPWFLNRVMRGEE